MVNLFNLNKAKKEAIRDYLPRFGKEYNQIKASTKNIVTMAFHFRLLPGVSKRIRSGIKNDIKERVKIYNKDEEFQKIDFDNLSHNQESKSITSHPRCKVAIKGRGATSMGM